jgi:taurine dioxygenase
MATKLAGAQELIFTRIGGALGARGDGVDLAHPPGDDDIVGLREAFLEHHVLLFPGQGHITPAQQLAFARRWGEVILTPAPDKQHPEAPEILVLDIHGGFMGASNKETK